MAWHGESRRHGLARKGVKTVIDDKRRLAVNNYVAGGKNKLLTFVDDLKSGGYAVGETYDFFIDGRSHIEMAEVFAVQGHYTDMYDGVPHGFRYLDKDDVDEIVSKIRLAGFTPKVYGYLEDVGFNNKETLVYDVSISIPRAEQERLMDRTFSEYFISSDKGE